MAGAGTTLLLFLAGSRALASKEPTISFISGPEVVTDIGGNVELKCKVENAIAYPINWIKISGERGENVLAVSTGKSLILRSNRFKLVPPGEHNDYYILKIKDIKESDAGRYQCQVVVAVNNNIMEEVKLQVRLPPAISDKSTASLTVKAGERAEINCLTSGFPKPTIKWRRLDGVVMPSGKVEDFGNPLIIKSARKEDRGGFHCTADNGVGESQSREMTLSVEFGPSISLPRPRIHQAAYYDAELVCNIVAFPDPYISWTLDGEPILNKDNYNVVHFVQEEGLTASTVKVTGIRPEQFGAYKCHASNSLGEATSLLELVKTEIPVPVAPYGAASSIKALPGLFLTAILFTCL